MISTNPCFATASSRFSLTPPSTRTVRVLEHNALSKPSVRGTRLIVLQQKIRCQNSTCDKFAYQSSRCGVFAYPRYSSLPTIPPPADILLECSPNIRLTEVPLAKTSEWSMSPSRAPWGCRVKIFSFLPFSSSRVARYFLLGRTWVDEPSLWGSLGLEPASCLEGKEQRAQLLCPSTIAIWKQSRVTRLPLPSLSLQRLCWRFSSGYISLECHWNAWELQLG